jgi:hypothetical protein
MTKCLCVKPPPYFNPAQHVCVCACVYYKHQVFMLVRGEEDTPITLEFGRAGGKYKITLYRKGADYDAARRGNSRNSQ